MAIGLTAVLGWGLLVLAASIAGAPPDTDIVPPGSTRVNVQVFTVGDPQYVAPIPPSRSLAVLRCEAWLHERDSLCPDAAQLAATYWPGASQVSDTIYATVAWPTCDAQPPHFNAEFFGQTLTLHCHRAASWFQWHGPDSDSSARPSVELLAIPTAGMAAPGMAVYREDRVERWVSDDVHTELLGLVRVR